MPPWLIIPCSLSTLCRAHTISISLSDCLISPVSLTLYKSDHRQTVTHFFLWECVIHICKFYLLENSLKSVISEFAIYAVVRHGNANSIQNPSSVTNPTMELYCIFLPLMLPCCTTWQIANSLLTHKHWKVSHRHTNTKKSLHYVSYMSKVTRRLPTDYHMIIGLIKFAWGRGIFWYRDV